MNIDICGTKYTIEDKVDNLLSILNLIKTTQNNSLAYRSGCKSGVCGSCAVVVNGVEKLACKTTIKDDDIVTPLKNSKVIKDLIVDISNQEQLIKQVKGSLSNPSDKVVNQVDQKLIDIESNCILCSSCFSSCPVYEVDKEFLGPFALARSYRYINDAKEENIKEKIDTIQDHGIWSCTLCGNCNMVCPSHIDIKGDIMKLRNRSAQYGYSDPNMANFDMGFNTDFGFNPNGF